MAINPLQITNGPAPLNADFSDIGNLGNLYQAAQNKQKLTELGKKLANGTADYRAAAGQIADTGDLTNTLRFLALAEAHDKQAKEQAASDQFASGVGGIFKQGQQPQQPAQQPAQQPTANPAATNQPVGQPQARAPVQSSPTTWGDKEAENAGLYEKPKPTATLANLGPSAQPAPSNAAAPPVQPATPQPQANTGFQGLNASHVPMLLSAVANPNLPAGQKDIAKTLLTRALDDSKEPDKIRTLNAIKEQSGYPGTILDLEKEIRAAGKTNVTVDQRGENEEAKAAGKAAGERRAAMMGAANSATNNLASLTRVQTLLDQVDQGKLAPSRMTIGAWAKSLGVNDEFAKSLGLDPKKVGDAQALQAMTNELVLGKIGAGGLPANNFSDADRQFLTDTLPKLGNDPRANKILIEGARRVHQDSIQRALDYQTWKEDPANRGKSFEDFEFNRAQRVSKMDRFGDLRKQAEGILGQPVTSGATTSGLKWSVQ